MASGANRCFRASAAWRSFSFFSDEDFAFAVWFGVGDGFAGFGVGFVVALDGGALFVAFPFLAPAPFPVPTSPPRFRPLGLLVSLGCGRRPGLSLPSLRPRLLSDRPPFSSAPRPRLVPRSGNARSKAAVTLGFSTVPNFAARSWAFCCSVVTPLSPSALELGMPKRAARAARLASSVSGLVDGRWDVKVSGSAGVLLVGAGFGVGLSLDEEAGVEIGAGAEMVKSLVLDGSMAAIWFGTAMGVGAAPAPAALTGAEGSVGFGLVAFTCAGIGFEGTGSVIGEVVSSSQSITSSVT